VSAILLSKIPVGFGNLKRLIVYLRLKRERRIGKAIARKIFLRVDIKSINMTFD
jgi:hypothetical protein